ncbi:MAG: glycosyltransferase family 9 protein [Candidatus Moranbacteria bacterium]|nr:glycosyltransferase family 9 protein [Candidatus Moranbacteria bacterium]
MQKKNEIIQQKDKELERKTCNYNSKIEEMSNKLIQKDQELHAIHSSLQWQIPNFFFKRYRKYVKPRAPKFVFKIFKPFFVFMKNLRNHGGEKEPLFGPKITYYIGKAKGSIKNWFGLGRMAFDELRYNGFEGLMFAYKRHMKKKHGEIPADYARVDDYIPNLVTIGILSINHLELIRPCLESIEQNLSDKYKIEIIVGDTGTKEKKVWNFYKHAEKNWNNVRIMKIGKYHFCRNYNQLFSKYAKGQYLILLNNDTVVKGNWIDELVDPLADKRIGIVGGKLLYKNGTIQHAGMEFRDGNALAVYAKQEKDLPEANFKAFVPVLTFACVAVRHDVYNRFRMDENYREEAQDTDFCLRAGEAGFKALYNPECEVFHLECSTRDWRKGERDRNLLKKQWGGRISKIASESRQRIKFDPDEYKNSIAVLRDDGIGDLLMGVGAFANLRKKYPDKKLILATYGRNVEMMMGFGIFDELVPIPNGQKYPPLPIPKDSETYDLRSLEMDFSPMHGKPLETNKTNRHEVFSEILGLDMPFELVPMPDYPGARKKVENLFRKEGVDIKQNFVVFNLIASNPARSWWEPYYPELIKAVEDAGFVPLIVGTKDSEFYRGSKVVNLIGKTKTIAEFIEVVKLGKYVISTDTSAYHVAALSGIPFLAIFTGGVKPEARLGFYGKYEVCEPPASLKCYPCWDEGCKDLSVRWKKDPCRLIIKPEEVIEKFKKLVEKYPG